MAALIRHGRIEKPHSPDAAEVLRLEPADDPAALAHRLDAVARVEVNFPSLADGRGYSIARLLRERYGYGGELRAVGDVQDADGALAALRGFSEAYQSSVERPLPLFRRRGVCSSP